MPSSIPTRQRVLTEAMRLFGEQGYSATTVAQIESAAGLKSGSGGLYRHFASKQHLLEAGLREQLASKQELMRFVADPGQLGQLPLRDRLMAVARAGLARLQAERDLNRIMLRDLRFFPELAELVRTEEIAGIQRALSAWLSVQIDPAPELDWDALSAVLMNGVSHYWVLEDSLGSHPSGIDESRYLETLVDLVAVRMIGAQSA
ncbi:MAG TPA: TetR/AcrR family transcriptional regulator [Microbacteriaceae bacterium]